jgi:hypothetical protein
VYGRLHAPAEVPKLLLGTEPGLSLLRVIMPLTLWHRVDRVKTFLTFIEPKT